MAGTLLGNFATLAFQAVTARTLTPADYGALAVAITLATSASLTISSSVATLVRRHVPVHVHAETWGEVRGVLRLSLAVTSALCAVVVVPTLLLRGTVAAQLLKDSRLTGLVGLFCIAIALNAVVLYQRAVLHAYVRPGYAIAHSLVFERIIRIALAIGVVVAVERSGRLYSFAWVHVGALAAAAAFGVYVLRHRLRPGGARVAATLTDARGLFVFAASAFAVDMVGAAYEYGDVAIVSSLLSAEEAGKYIAAYTLGAQPTIVVSSIATVFLPMITVAVAARDTDRLGALLAGAMRTIGALVAPLAAFVAVTASDLLAILFGERFADAAPVLSILMASNLVASLFSLLGITLFAYDRNWRAFVLVGAALASEVVIALALIPRYGLQGAAIANVSAACLLAALRVHAVRRSVSALPGTLTALPFILSAAVSTLPAVIVRRLLAGSPRPLVVVVAGTVFMGVYAIMLLLTRAVTREELRRFALLPISWGRRASSGN